MVGWLILAECCSVLLLLILLFPKKWASIVDRENAFWVAKGLLSERTARRFTALEKGKGLRLLLLSGLLLGAALAFMEYLTGS